MRIFLGFLVAAAALSVAVYLHSGSAKLASYHYYGVGVDAFGNATTDAHQSVGHRKASWQDPLAIFVAVAGVGAGVAIALPAIRRT